MSGGRVEAAARALAEWGEGYPFDWNEVAVVALRAADSTDHNVVLRLQGSLERLKRERNDFHAALWAILAHPEDVAATEAIARDALFGGVLGGGDKTESATEVRDGS